MHRIAPLLAVVALTGCTLAPDADPDVVDDDPVGTSSSELVITGVTIPKEALEPQPRFPIKPSALVFQPLVPACTTKQGRFAVLTRSCAPLREPGGQFSARPVFTSAEGTLCEMRWHPDRIVDVAPVPYEALERIAELETSGIWGDRPAIVPLCDTTFVCNADNTSCVERTQVAEPTTPPRVDGMGGCSSCAFVDGNTLYAVLPPDYTTGTVQIDIGPSVLYFAPAGAQTFRVDVSGYPSRSGYAYVTRR